MTVCLNSIILLREASTDNGNGFDLIKFKCVLLSSKLSGTVCGYLDDLAPLGVGSLLPAGPHLLHPLLGEAELYVPHHLGLQHGHRHHGLAAVLHYTLLLLISAR